jgi:mono/diheme cytochrome c family protein
MLAVAGLVAGLAACQEQAERPPAETVSSGGPGRILYLTYCESCHGRSGQGNGTAASSLRTPPPDLTRLWMSYGTPLDRGRLVEYIDGRQLLGLHGPRDMPVWGVEFFEGVPPTTPNLEDVRLRLIEVLVQYLETIQSKQQT